MTLTKRSFRTGYTLLARLRKNFTKEKPQNDCQPTYSIHARTKPKLFMRKRGKSLFSRTSLACRSRHRNIRSSHSLTCLPESAVFGSASKRLEESACFHPNGTRVRWKHTRQTLARRHSGTLQRFQSGLFPISTFFLQDSPANHFLYVLRCFLLYDHARLNFSFAFSGEINAIESYRQSNTRRALSF